MRSHNILSVSWVSSATGKWVSHALFRHETWMDRWMEKKRRIGCRCWWLKGCGRGKEISILMMEGGSSKELHKRGKRWDRTGRGGLLFKICNRKKFISINLRCPAQKGHTWHWTDILHDKNLLVYTDFVYFFVGRHIPKNACIPACLHL